MATSHFARTVYKGNPGHGGAARRVQYITRTAEQERAEGLVRHLGYVPRTEDMREDLVEWQARNLPEWAEGDPVVFFSAAERHTSAAWTAYEEWKFALPRELDRPQQVAAARDFLQSAFGDRHPHVWAMHDPLAADGGRQPHVHVLWSRKMVDEVARTPELFFRRYNAAHPERGGAQASAESRHFGSVKAARVLYTDVMNWHLGRAGQEARLHPDRLEARGILREPEPRLTPRDSNALKFHGEVTPDMQRVLDHRQRYAVAKQREQALARTYWEERKQVLGLARDLERTRSLSQIREARTQRRQTAPARAAIEESRPSRLAPSRLVGERLRVPLVGNRQSRIFHQPGDHNYGDVRPHHQVLFWSVVEAEAAGYRAAKNQHYGRGAEQRREGLERLPHSPTSVRERNREHPGWPGPEQPRLTVESREPFVRHGHAVRSRIFEREGRGDAR